MNNVAKEIAKQAMEDGKATIRKAIRQIVTQVEQDFVKQAHTYMDEYYNEYVAPDNKYYNKRTGNLRARNHAITPHRRYRADEVEVGVMFSSDNMDDYVDKNGNKRVLHNSPFKTLEDLVVTSALQGYHGYAYHVNERDTIDNKMKEFQSTYDVKVLDNYFRNLGFEV